MDCTIREKETKFAKELQRKEKEVLFAANYYLRKGKGDISLAVLHRQILFIYSVNIFSSFILVQKSCFKTCLKHKK